MRVKYLVLAGLMLTILIPQYVSAQGSAQDNKLFYVTLKPGIYSPHTSDLEDFNTGFYGEMALGFRPIKYFAAELGVGYFHTDATQSSAGTINGFGFTQRDKFDIDVLPVTFTAKLIFPYKKFEFFGLGGVGAYIVWASLEAKGTINGIPFSEKLSGNDSTFGGYLGLGIHYNITPRIFVGAEGKYLWTDRAKPKTELFEIPLEFRFKLNGVLATAVLGFRF